jgi:hypothetical protein
MGCCAEQLGINNPATQFNNPKDTIFYVNSVETSDLANDFPLKHSDKLYRPFSL